MSPGIRRASAPVLTLVLSLLATNAVAQDIDFTLDRENFSFGREVPLSYPFSCETRNFGIAEVEDDGAGQLAFTVTEDSGAPVVGCVPVPEAFIDLKWLYTLTPGDYELTVRQDSGDQQFSFTVRDSALDSGPAQTGSWFDPAQSGHGLNLEFFSDGRVIAYWYAYDDDGDNLWLLGDGRYDGDRAVFEVFEADGDGFPPNYDPDSHGLEPWGQMTLTFDSCSKGTLSWTTSVEGFEDGEMPLDRLSPTNGEPCLDDDREADAWNTVNLLADDPELNFELLNASIEGSDSGGDWTLAFEDLPEALGGGRGLTARPATEEEFTRFYLGTIIRGSQRTESQDRNASTPFSLLGELTVAVPGEVSCDQVNSLSVSIGFMDNLWDPASEEAQEPLADVLFDEYVRVPATAIGALHQTDCETVDDYLVRTFITPAMLSAFDARWAMLTVSLANVDPDSDAAVEGPVYLLDFRVRGRETQP